MIIRTIAVAMLLGLVACKPPIATNFAEAKYPWPVEHADVDGTSIAYADIGSGEKTIVLVHGLGSYMPAWKKNAADLAVHHRVILVDLPGYGKSAKPDAPYTMTYFAAKLRGLLDKLGVEQPAIVGHSMGGQVAMTYALMYPERYTGLVLTSPAGLEVFEDGEAKWLANAVTPGFTCAADDEAIFTRHAGNFVRMPKDAHFMVEDRIGAKQDPTFPDYCEAVSRSVAGMLDEPVHDRIPEIEKPVLVIFGAGDNLIPNPFLHGGSTVKLAKQATERFADAKLIILPKAGHMAQFEAAEQWNEDVLAFLGELEAGAAPPPPVEAKPELPPKTALPAQTAPEPEPEPEPEPVIVDGAEPLAPEPEPVADPPNSAPGVEP